jgi:hypothetical protein
MNKNDPASTTEVPERRIRLFGVSCNLKIFLAFILGVLAFFLLFGLGAALEGASGKASGKFGEYALTAALVIVIGVYFLIAQYFLSRGNPQALRKVWPLIMAMNFVLLCAPILCLVLETKGAALGTLLLAMFTVACSYAGVALAARTARQ